MPLVVRSARLKLRRALQRNLLALGTRKQRLSRLVPERERRPELSTN